jgi:predicted dehydrogenase
MLPADDNPLNRRSLLGLAGAGLLGISATSVQPVFGASNGAAAHDWTGRMPEYAETNRALEPTRIALIGCGGQGRANLREFLKKEGVTCVAVCDPDSKRMAQIAGEVEENADKAPDMVKDFRKVLERKDVDAVIVATPDHWHAIPTILACDAGKDVFCEKPISHNIVEGRRMVRFAEKTGRTIQVGTWQRSLQPFLDAIAYVRSGKIGRIQVARAWKIQAPGAAVLGKKPITPAPAEIDYDLWLGPAPKVDYRENRCHYNHRWYFEYAGGMAGDWGVHMMDTVLQGMSQSDDLNLPDKVVALGGKFYAGPDDDRTTPDTQIALYEFPGWLMQWEVHVGDTAVGMEGGRDHGALFIGSEGRVLVDRGGWTITDAKGKPVEKPAARDWGGNMNGLGAHVQEFLDNRLTKKKTRSNIASMHQTTTVCHLANLAYLAGETLHWDSDKEVVTNRKEAMKLLPYQRLSYRKPWSLPKA